jgi:hypothetical protein
LSLKKEAVRLTSIEDLFIGQLAVKVKQELIFQLLTGSGNTTPNKFLTISNHFETPSKFLTI